MVKKRIVKKRKVPEKRNVLDNDSDDGVEENDDEVAEQLRLEAMKAGGREWKELAKMVVIGKEIKIPVARGAATCSVISNDGEWVWYGDKNGNVFRMNLTTHSDWVQMARHKGQVLCMAITDIEKYTPGVYARGSRSTQNTTEAKYDQLVATGSSDGTIKIFNAEDGTVLHELTGHRGGITGLSFRIGKNVLISGSNDRTVKVWAAEDGVLLDTFYGHTGKVTSVTAGWRDEALTTGDDCTTRLFKFEKGTTSAFAEGVRVVETSAFVNDVRYVVGGSDGAVNLYDVNKRRPASRVEEAHGVGWLGDGDGLEHRMSHSEIQDNIGTNVAEPRHPNWVTAVGAVPYSDLVASGGFGNELKLWRVASKDTDFVKSAEAGNNELKPLKSHKIHGIPNSIFFPRSGSHLIATISREPRLGRWLTDSSASNHILILPLSYTNEPTPSDDEVEEDTPMDLEEGSENGDPEAPKAPPTVTAPKTKKKMVKRVVRPKRSTLRKLAAKKKQLILR